MRPSIEIRAPSSDSTFFTSDADIRNRRPDQFSPKISKILPQSDDPQNITTLQLPIDGDTKTETTEDVPRLDVGLAVLAGPQSSDGDGQPSGLGIGPFNQIRNYDTDTYNENRRYQEAMKMVSAIHSNRSVN
jgi:hypothetical protein